MEKKNSVLFLQFIILINFGLSVFTNIANLFFDGIPITIGYEGFDHATHYISPVNLGCQVIFLTLLFLYIIFPSKIRMGYLSKIGAGILVLNVLLQLCCYTLFPICASIFDMEYSEYREISITLYPVLSILHLLLQLTGFTLLVARTPLNILLKICAIVYAPMFIIANFLLSLLHQNSFIESWEIDEILLLNKGFYLAINLFFFTLSTLGIAISLPKQIRERKAVA